MTITGSCINPYRRRYNPSLHHNYITIPPLLVPSREARTPLLFWHLLIPVLAVFQDGSVAVEKCTQTILNPIPMHGQNYADAFIPETQGRSTCINFALVAVFAYIFYD
ncbi:hypothetical protein AVEN_174557-1 [Araneus ventricosus]|uniref:Uncharacterized protein n=1 Tax=Araneus ventricosus TaxID=182803 RepID=A0A4Y2KE52_ARAVE|nr:hypothetical protein AVEN_174557-1 [Araneus ventricosus]